MGTEKGVRIQKVLSENGIMSRRKAEEAVAQGRVTVNGHPATAGQPVNVRRDVIAIDGVRVALAKKQNKVYYMLHKPRGYVTTTKDELGRRSVMDLVSDLPEKVYPVGRLDRNSEGLLLFTNDGVFAHMMMHPSAGVGKTYRVTVRPGITDEQAARLAGGVELPPEEHGPPPKDGEPRKTPSLNSAKLEKTLPASVTVLERTPERAVLQMTIQEGKNRQIRRMCQVVGLEVIRLKRTALGPLKLGMLQPGDVRPLKPSELIALRRAHGAK